MGRTSSRSGKKKKSPKAERKAEDAIDRISELPDSLISHIFSFLEMKDVVKTSVLSKRWKKTWTHVDSIVFDAWADDHRVKYLTSFLDDTLTTLMESDPCSKIKKFCISRPFKLCYSVAKDFGQCMGELLDKWLEFVLVQNVEVLKLDMSGLDYVIPSCLYSSSSLVELEIQHMGRNYFNLDSFVSIVSLDFDGIQDKFYYKKRFDVSWTALKKLSLKFLYVPQELMEQILSGSSVLETLVLQSVTGVSVLNITNPSLKELILINFFADDVDNIQFLKITAPWVENLEVSGKFHFLECNLVNAFSLKNAKLTLGYYEFPKLDIPENNDIIWSDMIDMLLEPASRADELSLGEELLQALSLMRMTSNRSLTFECKYLTIRSPICQHEVPGIVCLLESSPNLETLVIRIMPFQCRKATYILYHHYAEYMDKVFTCFRGVDYLSQQKKKLPCLKNVRIECGEKLNFVSDAYSCELEITAYIIRNAEFLKKLVISFSKSNSCESYAARYLSLLSSKRKIGEKARHWKRKKINSTYKFSFST